MFSKEMLQIVRRLQNARLSLMHKQPFYAVLLLHMQFSVDTMCETAYTDGERIAFCPSFIETLSDEELEFVLMHEVLHAALNHAGRTANSYDFDKFNTACDIVVNSNILYSNNMDVSAITLKDYGEQMHVTPDGKEGYNYSAEEVYDLVLIQEELNKKSKSKDKKEKSNNGNGLPQKSDSDEKSEENNESARSDGGFDDHTYWGQDDDDEDDDSSNSCNKNESSKISEDEMREVWLERMIEATQMAEHFSQNSGSNSCGKTPLCAERIVKEFTEPQTDWRTVLDMFIQEEITDYSFNPPDRRFSDSPFLLPDYNEKEESVKDVLFMIDTSGSMSDKMITQAYSEIYGAIQQFDGKLQGWLGFFDATVVEPKEFTDEEEFKIIRPAGGGGTSFTCIFDYVQEHIDEIAPTSIIILTDGYAPWPNETDVPDIPVLWIINNDDATPPWGKVTRIKIDK